jgi:hypothetical protein
MLQEWRQALNACRPRAYCPLLTACGYRLTA